MSAIQLSLLPDAWSPLDDTITSIQSLGVRHNNYVRFVRMVAASALGQRPGSIILCAALSDYDADEICSDIKQLVQETLEKKAESSSGFCMIDTPHALRPREMRTALIEAYHEANDLFCAQHRSGPRFLEGAPSYLGQNPAQRVASLLRIRDPQFYLFKNIQLLQRIDSAPSDALEFVRMLAHIASASGRTHILLGNSRTVLRWLDTREIAELAVPIVLEPYAFDDDSDKAHFRGILAAYDKALPWRDGPELVPNSEYVHRIVRGSSHRLRKWILNALCSARALAQVELTWKCFAEAEPPGTELRQATIEYRAIRAYLGKAEKSAELTPREPKADRKPGDRDLGRDSYAA